MGAGTQAARGSHGLDDATVVAASTCIDARRCHRRHPVTDGAHDDARADGLHGRSATRGAHGTTHESGRECIGECGVDLSDQGEPVTHAFEDEPAGLVPSGSQVREGGLECFRSEEDRRVEGARGGPAALRGDEAAPLLLGEQARARDMLTQPRDELQRRLQTERLARVDRSWRLVGVDVLLACRVDLRRPTPERVVATAREHESSLDEHVEVGSRDVRVDADTLAHLSGGAGSPRASQLAVDRGPGRDRQGARDEVIPHGDGRRQRGHGGPRDVGSEQGSRGVAGCCGAEGDGAEPVAPC